MGDYQTEELLTNPFSEMELELTRNEALFLDDSFTLMIEMRYPLMGREVMFQVYVLSNKQQDCPYQWI